jgi:predicted metal-dependent phosphoesterase TrpH
MLSRFSGDFTCVIESLSDNTRPIGLSGVEFNVAIYDLHTHSTVSDGILSPEDLVSRAKCQGVDVLALTDHDSVAGLACARKAAELNGMGFVDGIELSCQWGKFGVHIVGLNIDPENKDLLGGVKTQTEARAQRGVLIGEKLRKAGIEGALAGALKIANGSVLGRPHFAQYLVESGSVATMKMAFKKYLGAGKPGDVKNLWPDLSEAIGWIHAAGGVAVLAHPDKYKMTRTKLRGLISDFAAAGGEALEVISGKQTTGIADYLVSVGNQYGLHASCGSDFHKPDQVWQELGAFGTMPPNSSPVWHLWAPKSQ